MHSNEVTTAPETADNGSMFIRTLSTGKIHGAIDYPDVANCGSTRRAVQVSIDEALAGKQCTKCFGNDGEGVNRSLEIDFGL